MISEVDRKHQGMLITPLSDLFHNADGDPNIKGENTFRVRMFIVRVDPPSPVEWVKGFDKKSKKLTSLKGGSNAGLILGYQVQLLCKDIST